MALGVPGTGPYGRIRELYRQIDDYKYKISLIDQDVKMGSKASYQKKITVVRAEIKQIRKKAKKKIL